MQIFIPTRDRLEAQYTWDNLTPHLRAQTLLVCPAEEVEGHVARGRRAVARPPVPLAHVRQWVVSTLAAQDQPVIMLDDDLGFFRRKQPDKYNLMPVSRTPALDQLFADLEALVAVHGYAHAGLCPRQGNNRYFPATLVHAMRINAVHCVDPRKLAEVGARYDAVDMMEDYHVVLTMLRAGYDNAVIADGAWDQVKGSGAPGGFSHYRTKQRQADAARKLAALHPGFVRLALKEPKTGQGEQWGGARLDVRVYWYRALHNQPLPPQTDVPDENDVPAKAYEEPVPVPTRARSYRKDRETRKDLA